MAIAAVRVQVPLRVRFAEVAQLVEHNLAKVRVAGSSPVFRSASIKALWFFGIVGLFYVLLVYYNNAMITSFLVVINLL